MDSTYPEDDEDIPDIPPVHAKEYRKHETPADMVAAVEAQEEGAACSFKPGDTDPCPTCPRLITALYMCGILKDCLIDEPVWVVQRWSQYKLGSAPFAHDENADKPFTSEEEALDYERKADSGIGGDTRYRYVVVPPKEGGSDE